MKDEPMIPLRESREAVGFSAIFFGVIGFCVGAAMSAWLVEGTCGWFR